MDKIALLLKSLGANAHQIAGKTGLSEERVHDILDGAKVTLPELRALARGLRIPLNSFANGVRPADRNATMRLLFRRGASAADAFDPVQEFVADFVEAALEILPQKPELPEWLGALTVERETYEEAERLAYEVRSLFFPERLEEPIPDLAEVLSEKGGVIVGRLRMSRYEGVSLIANNYPFIFVSPRFVPRMLFTLAHELGHLVAHHVSNETALFERPGEVTNFRKRSKSEAFVDAFASILLMPERGVATVLKSVREILDIQSDEIGDIEILFLARIYGVSFEVAARRCENLDLLPEGGSFSLAEEIKKNYGSPEKRAAEVGMPERVNVHIPQVSKNLMESLIGCIEEGAVSAGWGAEKFGISIGDIYSAHAEITREHNY